MCVTSLIFPRRAHLRGARSAPPSPPHSGVWPSQIALFSPRAAETARRRRHGDFPSRDGNRQGGLRQGSPRRRLQHLRQVRVRPSLPSRPSFRVSPSRAPSPDDRSPAPDSCSYIRRQETQERVIGTLLGTVSPDGVVEVKNSYAVPHNEQDDTVFVDVEFHRAMIDLHQKVNPGEKIVGWYSTGDGIVPTDALIHEFYAHECVDPVHVTLDVNFVDRSKLGAWTGRSPRRRRRLRRRRQSCRRGRVAAPATPEKDENTGSRSASEATERPAAAPPAATHFKRLPSPTSLTPPNAWGRLCSPTPPQIPSRARRRGSRRPFVSSGRCWRRPRRTWTGWWRGRCPRMPRLEGGWRTRSWRCLV